MLLVWTALFILLALASGVLGFTRLSAAAATIAKFLAFVFLVAALAFLVQGLLGGFREL